MNLLIRDIPEDVVAALDAEAARQGLSRSEYLRRVLTHASSGQGRAVSVAQFAEFEQTFADLGDPAVMDQAWR